MQHPEPILVTGGTGTLGRLVVARLREAGLAVRVLSRHPGEPELGAEMVTGDLRSDQGLGPAFAGVGTVVHCAGTAKGDDAKAKVVVGAAARAGIRHLVFISVVGAERVPVQSRVDRALFGYFAAKREAELVIGGSGLPWTTLRATQFHQSLLGVVRAMAKLPVIPVAARARFQPVDAREVADRLVDLALSAPAGLVADLAGPEISSMAELVASYLKVTGRRRRILSLPLPGGAARAIREGANLAPEHTGGHLAWEAFLAEATAGRPGGAGRAAPQDS